MVLICRVYYESEQFNVSGKIVLQITTEESVIVIVVMRYIRANDDLPEEITCQLR